MKDIEDYKAELAAKDRLLERIREALGPEYSNEAFSVLPHMVRGVRDDLERAQKAGFAE
jgi:hypothetical protein